MRLETFLVRIWTGADSDDGSMSTARQPDLAEPHGDRFPSEMLPPPDGMRGVVRHVRSGSQSTFAGEADLLAILRAAMAPSPPAPVAVPAAVARMDGVDRLGGEGT